MRSPDTHIIFDIDLAKKQTSENPLFYVQYAYSRINSIVKNASAKGMDREVTNFDGYELSDDDRKIIRKIFWFERSLIHSAKDLSPHHLTGYLIELAREFHGYYERNRVIDESNITVTGARILILKAVKVTIKKGLDILGVLAPEQM
jgi:arginyl-tRNA synthetase